jgi:hypothetical protein
MLFLQTGISWTSESHKRTAGWELLLHIFSLQYSKRKPEYEILASNKYIILVRDENTRVRVGFKPSNLRLTDKYSTHLS